jgi:hypothetical protein
LARLALEQAAEKRAMRKAALQPMSIAQQGARRSLRLRNRRQRVVAAILQQRVTRPATARTGSRSRTPYGRIPAANFVTPVRVD